MSKVGFGKIMATAKMIASVISNPFLDFTGCSAGVDVGLAEDCGAVCGLLRGFFTGVFLFCGVFPTGYIIINSMNYNTLVPKP